MVLFTHNVKNIKGAAHKNGDVDVTWIQAVGVSRGYTDHHQGRGHP